MRRATTALLLGLLLGAGCIVNETKADILAQLFICDVDDDCTDGWICRAYPMDPARIDYCVQSCSTDADCEGETHVCGQEGFCLERCTPGQDDCRYADQGWGCLRANMTPGENAGYCHPPQPCSGHADCGQDFNLCLGTLTDAMFQATIEPDFALCIQDCTGGTTCTAGFSCVTDVLNQLGGGDAFPSVCVPNCGQGNTCPTGFRCLQDSLEELYPGGDFGTLNTAVCVPGFSGSVLPCQDDRDCLVGVCVDGPAGSGGFQFCALPCASEAECPDVGSRCLDSAAGGTYCFPGGGLQPCLDDDNCTSPDRCLSFEHLGAGKFCTLPCSGHRDAVCGEGTTCVPLADPTGSPGFGCYTGLPGYPCANATQCNQDEAGPLDCLGPGGVQGGPDAVCTKTCISNAGCDFGLLTLNAPLCLQGICHPFGFACDPGGGPLPVPYTCPAGEMACEDFFGLQSYCTIPCPGLRPTQHGCPAQATCVPSTITNPEYYCFWGLPGLPCREDSECTFVRPDQTPTCESITGSSTGLDGTCSIPCLSDIECRDQLGESTSNSFCLPGAPAEGETGQCFPNPAWDVFVLASPGLQGTFCDPVLNWCDPDHRCLPPASGIGGVATDLGPNYCARECTGDGQCSQSPVPHSCVQAGVGNRVCRPMQGAPGGRLFAEGCFDHRQCQTGICAPNPQTPDPDDRFCTRTCGSLSPDCNGLRVPATCVDGICVPGGNETPADPG